MFDSLTTANPTSVFVTAKENRNNFFSIGDSNKNDLITDRTERRTEEARERESKILELCLWLFRTLPFAV